MVSDALTHKLSQRRLKALPIDSGHKGRRLLSLAQPLLEQTDRHLTHRDPLAGRLRLHLAVKGIRNLKSYFYLTSLLYYWLNAKGRDGAGVLEKAEKRKAESD